MPMSTCPFGATSATGDDDVTSPPTLCFGGQVGGQAIYRMAKKNPSIYDITLMASKTRKHSEQANSLTTTDLWYKENENYCLLLNVCQCILLADIWNQKNE
jgi:hypothetical protein